MWPMGLLSLILCLKTQIIIYIVESVVVTEFLYGIAFVGKEILNFKSHFNKINNIIKAYSTQYNKTTFILKEYKEG